VSKRVLIVDDSALVRKQLRELIETLDFEIDMAKNGREAVDKALANNYDVITMDINMPVLDGLSAVEAIMKENPTPILMISSLTTESASTTMEALELGAVDYIGKPGTMNIGKEENSEDIVRKVRSLSRIPKRRLKAGSRRPVVRERTQPKVQENSELGDSRDIKKIVLIGASTGGPGLVEQICASLPANYPYPVCIVQHMPEQFTSTFASRIDRVCQLPVHESANNLEVLPGHVYVAKGGVHMHFAKKVSGKIVLREESDKNNQFFQPSVDEMFMSALSLFSGPQILGVLLTGIGDDGADGMVAAKKSGAYTVGESEETATVYGMPKEAYERGGVVEQLPFPKIPKLIATFR
jgi:two-component system chemotaxis response regulator CheB